MDKVSIVDQIYKNDNVLSIPNVISRLLELTRQDDYSANDLAKLILNDPSLTGKIIKFSNSSFYARGSKITSINQAISLLIIPGRFL